MARVGVVVENGDGGEIFVGGGVVGENEGIAGTGVPEVGEDAFVHHEAAGEGEMRFALFGRRTRGVGRGPGVPG